MALCGLAAFSRAQAPQYDFHVFAPDPGYGTSAAISISNAGQVLVLQTESSSGNWGDGLDNAYVWSSSGVTNVNPLGSPNVMNVFSIRGNYVACLTPSGLARYNLVTGATDLLTSNGASGAYISGMNSQGDISGGLLGHNIADPAVWLAGSTNPSMFFSQSGASEADSYAVNELGEVAGYDHPEPSEVTWIATNYATNNGFDTVYTVLPDPSGDNSSEAMVLSNNGIAAGRAFNSTGRIVTVLWNYQAAVIQPQVIYTQTTNRFLPTGINEDGIVVGGTMGRYRSNPGWVQGNQAFVYVNNQVYDLSSLVHSIDGGYQAWHPCQAWDVNDAGQIVGVMTDGSQHYAGFVATPVQASAARLSLTVSLQNFNGDPTQVPVTVELRQPGTTTVVQSFTVNPDSNGVIQITATNPGTYDVAVKASHWLRRVVPNVTLTAGSTASASASVINGDINGDNAVTLGDFAQQRSAFGSSPGDSNWNPNADLNGDGAVTLGDFAILRSHFGAQGDN